jgi:nucleoside-triphosphatase THEP1
VVAVDGRGGVRRQAVVIVQGGQPTPRRAGGSRLPDNRAIAMRTDDSFDRPPAVAAILHDGQCDIDALLSAFVQRERARGRRVHGLLMTYRDRAEGCRSSMFLTDIDTGAEYLVSQALGSGSGACSADPQGFAQASGVLRDALERAPDLVVSNRFGSLEAENGGFVAELLALISAGIPLLTVVSTRHLDAWQRFVGEAPLLPCDPEAWAAWLDGVCLKRCR